MADTLIRELTAHRTMALRLVLGENPDAALTAVVHALALRAFHRFGGASCLDLTPRSEGLGGMAAGIDGTPAGRGVADRHEAWARRLPDAPEALWRFVTDLDQTERLALLAHCAGLSVSATGQGWGRTSAARSASDAVAVATGLDMTRYWTATARSYFGQVTKAQVLEAVREAVSEDAAKRLEGLKKAPMAEAAEAAVAGTGWLPAVLRMPLVGPEPDRLDVD